MKDLKVEFRNLQECHCDRVSVVMQPGKSQTLVYNGGKMLLTYLPRSDTADAYYLLVDILPED